jgi:threonine dehydratase
VKIIAAEPEQADDAYRSFKAGHIIADDAPETIADGLKVPLKELTWHFVRNHVTDILTASEQEIVDAMKLTWKPACGDGAVLRAAARHHPEEPRRLPRQARGRRHHRRQRRSGQAALDQGVRRTR